MKRMLSLVLAAVLLCSVCPAAFAAGVSVTKIIPEHPNLTLAPGISWGIYWTVEPANASNQDVNWTSSNPKVASVSGNGVIVTYASGSTKIVGTAADGSGVKVAVNVTVRAHDIIITKQGDLEVDFETEEENVAISIRNAGTVTNKNCDRKFKTKNGCVTSPENKILRPVKAGSDTVSIVYMEKKKPVKTETYQVFVAPSALGEAPSKKGAGEPVRFLGLNWGDNFPAVRTQLEDYGRGLKPISQRNEYLRSMLDGEVHFGNLTAFSAAVNFYYTPGDRMYEVRNQLFKGDYYFDPEIPYETVKQAVRSVYSLDKGLTDGDTCSWQRDDVQIFLTKKSRFTVLELIWVGEAKDEEAPEEDAEAEADAEGDESAEKEE